MVTYAFDEFELDMSLFELRRSGEPRPMEPQVFTVLAFLVEHHDRTVTKNELIEHVWHDRFISESALTSRLMAARKALGDSGHEQRYIKTVHGRGYRFLGEIRVGERVAETTAGGLIKSGSVTPPVEHQEIRLCNTADGTRIAYATSGSGPPLVKAANWLSHLEFDWRSPVWRHWMSELSRDHTLVRYDERGCGLSDRDVSDFSLDAWVRDLECVVDELNLERFPLLGISQGGPVAISYAVRHPERVSHLVLYGSFALGYTARATTQDELDENEALITLIRRWWGLDDPSFRQLFSHRFIPGGSPEHHRWFNDVCRVSTSPANAARFVRAFGEINVRDLLRQLTAPTLVLHTINDLRAPLDQARLLAAEIPDARLVPLDGRNHILLEDEPAWPRFLSEVRAFLGVAAPAAPARSTERAILFITLQSSRKGRSKPAAATAAALQVHRSAVLHLVSLHGGRDAEATADGLIAIFPSATRALECAVAIQRANARLAEPDGRPLDIRIGVHATDSSIDMPETLVRGPTVAREIAAKAIHGDILASDSVRLLAEGRGFDFSNADDATRSTPALPLPIHRVAWRDTLDDRGVA